MERSHDEPDAGCNAVNQPRSWRLAPLALVAICALAPIAAQTVADARSGWSMVDFRAYYCAALALRNHENPYYLSPMRTCEYATPQPFYDARSRAVVPAPYPPYALATLAPLTYAPFGIAVVVWYALMVIACIVAGIAAAEVAGVPQSAGIAALSLSLGLTSLPSGNVMPIAVAAISLAATFCRRGNILAAAILLAIGMVEPNITLPAAIGAFVTVPEIRVPLVVAAVCLSALSLVAGGFSRNVQFFMSVLPAHALSEVSRDNQYSLSTVLAAVGLHDRQAILAGTICYVVTTTCGVVAGSILARRRHDASFPMLLPCAFALVGATFVHTQAIAAAVPAAMALAFRRIGHRFAASCALLLLSVPWMFATSLALCFAPIVPIAYLSDVLWNGRRRYVAIAIVTSGAIIAALFWLAAHTAPPIVHPVSGSSIDPRLTEAAWRRFVLGDSSNRPTTWLLRLPTWVGLFALIACAASAIRARHDGATAPDAGLVQPNRASSG